MTPSTQEEFCKDVRDLLEFYFKVSEKRKSGVQKLLSEVLSYAHPDISIDCSIKMRTAGNNSLNYKGYFVSNEVFNANKGEGLKKRNGEKVQITDEHIIPKAVVIEYLKDAYKNNTLSDSMILYMTKLLSYSCLVTAEENDLLQKQGLQRKMPDGWHFPEDLDFAKEDLPDLEKLDFFARYKKAGIMYVENPNVDKVKKEYGGYKNFY